MIPTIAVTAVSGAEERQRILNAGFDYYISKPYSIVRSRVVIEALVNKKFHQKKVRFIIPVLTFELNPDFFAFKQHCRVLLVPRGRWQSLHRQQQQICWECLKKQWILVPASLYL
jgi:DNA-binding response OmpR family regulator